MLNELVEHRINILGLDERLTQNHPIFNTTLTLGQVISILRLSRRDKVSSSIVNIK